MKRLLLWIKLYLVSEALIVQLIIRILFCWLCRPALQLYMLKKVFWHSSPRFWHSSPRLFSVHMPWWLFNFTIPRAGISHYHPLGWYWLMTAHGMVLLNTHTCASVLRKLERVFKNTIGWVSSTRRVKTI